MAGKDNEERWMWGTGIFFFFDSSIRPVHLPWRLNPLQGPYGDLEKDLLDQRADLLLSLSAWW